MKRRMFLVAGGAALLTGATSQIVVAQSSGLPTLEVDCANGWVYYGNLTFPAVRPLEQFRLPVTGRVTRVDYQPTWWPTENTRAADPTLPRAVPYDNPRNARGKGRIVMDFNESWMRNTALRFVRIHGNAREQDLHRRRSRGCLRLFDRDILTLMDSIGNSQPPIHFYG